MIAGVSLILASAVLQGIFLLPMSRVRGWAWEHVWLASAGSEKRYLQGIIQIAAAFHHYQRDNWNGASSLLEAGLGRLRDSPATLGAIALEPLCRAAREWAQALQQGRDPGKGSLPKIGAAPKAGNDIRLGER